MGDWLRGGRLLTGAPPPFLSNLPASPLHFVHPSPPPPVGADILEIRSSLRSRVSKRTYAHSPPSPTSRVSRVTCATKSSHAPTQGDGGEATHNSVIEIVPNEALSWPPNNCDLRRSLGSSSAAWRTDRECLRARAGEDHGVSSVTFIFFMHLPPPPVKTLAILH